MLRVLFNIILTVLVVAGAAVTVTSLIDVAGPGVGIMILAYPIAWALFFGGLAAYFVLRIFMGERIPSIILSLAGLIMTVFAVMFLVEAIGELPSGVSFMDRLNVLFWDGAITIVVLGMVTMIVAASKISRSKEEK